MSMRIVNILPLHQVDVEAAKCPPIERAYLRSCLALFKSQGAATFKVIHIDDTLRRLDWWATCWMKLALRFLHDSRIISYAHIDGTGRFAPMEDGLENTFVFDTSLSGTEIARRINAQLGPGVAAPPEEPCCVLCGAPRQETWDGGVIHKL
jgi:hypothetical protein